MKKLFRRDINGLRAIAIISVVLFHFNPYLLPGGFSGVDVFFVISGFLMTKIIMTGVGRGSFSILSFYIDRANRIMPALSILCISLIIFGYFFLTPFEFKELSKHSISSLSFTSNIIYSNEAGYFDVSALQKWLLHTWSLSVEWQFYILYPTLIIIISKTKLIHKIRFILSSLLVVSFFSNVYLSHYYPDNAYYSLISRAWEMMVGGLAFLIPLNLKEKNKRLYQSIGLVIVLISFITINNNDLWPGYLALMPTLGAYLILASNYNKSKLINSKILQLIGKYSYSIYLWHWPLLVAYKKYMPDINPSYIIAASFIFGAISFQLIEKNKNNKLTSSLFLFSMIISFIVLFTNGATFRYPEKESFIYNLKHNQDEKFLPEYNYSIDNIKNLRFIDKKSKHTVLFLGDSFIQQYYSTSLNNKKSNSLFYTEGGCMPIKNIGDRNNKCHKMDKLKELLNAIKFSKIIVGANWANYLKIYTYNENGKSIKLNTEKGRLIAGNKIDDLFKELKANTNNVYLIMPHPTGNDFDPKIIESKLLKDETAKKYIRKDKIVSSYKWYYEYIGKLTKKNGVTQINPMDYLCKDNECKVMDKGYKPFYRDCCHMLHWYAKKHAIYINNILNER
ncbi:acyltransferase [Vibrio sp. S11_S32]|uniref:acyltransferase family protein n=1 Tax=Vibrio sp. S11_S32 TaxID=2720225 RepID=UPI0016801C20|nr:acyltransferase family protein [Vibrio sp. S11_S32]MBD1576274.1 acyltransferase [Vibrio sp. S11_S32]